jgi:cation diffusion facilitator CzcD-associated flavoprotein CzcO
MDMRQPYDLLIIGGGIGGVISLKYAKDVGLNALLLERQGGVGGIWRRLPAWQDIQFRRVDWTLGDIPIEGEGQASILANVEAWVARFGLGPSIRLNATVTRACRSAELWKVHVGAETYLGKYLVVATGGHNGATIPNIVRSNSEISEYHSSELRDPGEVTGKTVVVVGSGASALDLLDLCFERHATRVIWVYRRTKWMRPTRQQKYFATDLRLLGRQQVLGMAIGTINHYVNADLRRRYRMAGIEDILPSHDFDFRRDQLIPGRKSMISNFARIERHRAEVSTIQGRSINLTNGDRLTADCILWATGYSVDLAYLDVPSLTNLSRLEEIAPRCGSFFCSLDAPNLFILAPAVLETNTSTPWAYAHAARSIMSHISGDAVFDQGRVEGNINYFDLVRFLAHRDRRNYLPLLWYLKYAYQFLWRPRDVPLALP